VGYVIGFGMAIVVVFDQRLLRERRHVSVACEISSGISSEIEKGIGMGTFVDEVGFSIESASENHHHDPDVQVEEVETIVSFPSP
jgi:hypothetical protein